MKTIAYNFLKFSNTTVKKNILRITFLFFFTSLNVFTQAQDFPGYRAGNYTGVNGVFFNPANIADSRYRFDINLFSISSFVGNNQASFSLNNLSFNDSTLKDQLLGSKAGLSSGLLNLDIHGPSVMFNTGKKMSFALTTRARVMANITDIDGKLLDKITNDLTNDPSLPYTINSNANQRMAVNAWTEFGVGAARILYDKGVHFFKTGLTLKYLSGAGNGYISINNLKATINEEPITGNIYLNNTTGTIATGFGGVRISDFEPADLTKMESTGLGGDIGFIYEYRPDYNKSEKNNFRRDLNKYKFRAGISLLDFGKIKYEKDLQRSGAYAIDITGAEKFYLSQLDSLDIDDYNKYFKSKPQFFTPNTSNTERDYKVSLPTSIQLDFDYHLHRGFYVNLSGKFPIGSKDVFSSRNYTSIGVTPRYEGKAIGFYLPVYYSSLSDFNAGISFRAGPFFIGSGSVLTALLGNSKQMDFHFGLRFGGLQKKKKEKKEDDNAPAVK